MRNKNTGDAYVYKNSLFSQSKHKSGRLGAVCVDSAKNLWRFSVYAPSCREAALVGSFNGWAPIPMQRSVSGIWSVETTAAEGDLYKFRFVAADGNLCYRADPCAHYAGLRPETASRLWQDRYRWHDRAWIANRAELHEKARPMAVYEVHLGSWRDYGDQPIYRAAAKDLAAYVADQGYTHIELMPITEYPFDGSWGYQVTGYFAPTSRYGTPADFKYFVDTMHRHGIGVLLDWVPAHFPRDAHGLRQFDGSPLFEHPDERMAVHEQWGTLRFNFDSDTVKDFLISSALFWLSEYHIDGLRIDAVSSMLYLDYDRTFSLQNRYGGKENLATLTLFRALNAEIHSRFPGVLTIAEEATDFPSITAPIESGGLGFDYKWNMGWMNDTLRYMQTDPIFRSGNHTLMTFSMMYAFNEHYVLPLSHDECVHGKKSLLDKMAGDYETKFAALRTYLAYMFTHPGKKLLFMGTELAPFLEWRFYEPLEWKMMQFDTHRDFSRYTRSLVRFYRENEALWSLDDSWDGFCWSNADDAIFEVLSYFRIGAGGQILLCVFNMTPVRRENYLLGSPYAGEFRLVLNSDPADEGETVIQTQKKRQGTFANALQLTLPPQSALIYQYSPNDTEQE